MKMQIASGVPLTACYIVPGLPHVLLAPERSSGWRSLRNAFETVRREIEESDAEMILYASTQWHSPMGYFILAEPELERTHVDPNWYEFGSIPYRFRIDTEFAKAYSDELKQLGFTVRAVKGRDYPLDTGSVVAQSLLNPDSRLPASMISCHLYAGKEETLSVGEAAMTALRKYGKRAVVVIVSGLSSRFETKEIEPAQDRISSATDDEWNRRILALFGEGRLEDVSSLAPEYARRANADLGFKGIWWLSGLCARTSEFTGRVFDYQPVWGTGAGVIGLYPKYR